VRNPEVEAFRPLAFEKLTTRGEVRRRPDQRRERENPGGEKTQESYALGCSLNRSTEWRTLAWSKTLKALGNAKRGTALGTAYGCAGGAKLWRVTP
jgi:hypothetical protein